MNMMQCSSLGSSVGSFVGSSVGSSVGSFLGPVLRCFPLLLLALGATLTAQTQPDIVKLRNGNQDSGTIESESYKELAIKSVKDHKTNRYPTEDVAEVSYGGSPEYTAAYKQVAGGNLAGAQRLAQLAGSDKLRKEIKPHALFYAAAAQQRAGNQKDALALYLELAKQFPSSSHLRQVAKAIVDCRIAGGEAAAGSSDLDALMKAAREAGVDDLFLSTLEVYNGRLLETQKKMVEAKVKYEQVAAVRNISPKLTAEAKLGVARCSQAEGQTQKAAEIYNQLKDQDVGNEVLAGAWNGLADIARDEAMKAKSAEKLLDTLFMYLRGVVEFAPAAGEGTTEYERSLAGSVTVFKALADGEADAAKKKIWTDRARERQNQLNKEFPNSPHQKGS